MYIEDRLFSERNSEEVLYSVLMNEEEYDLYSEFQERVFGNRGIKDALLGSHVGYTGGLDGTKTFYTHGNGGSLNGVTLDNNLKNGNWKNQVSNLSLHKQILKDQTHPLHEKLARNVRAGRELRRSGSYMKAIKYLK